MAEKKSGHTRKLTPRQSMEAVSRKVSDEVTQLIPKKARDCNRQWQWDLDASIDRNCMGEGTCAQWGELIVPRDQFEDYPATTVLLARACKVVLLFFILICVTALISAWIFEGKVSFVEEIDQAPFLPAPKVAICPQPWGSQFPQGFKVQDAKLIEIPGGETSQDVEWSTQDCALISGRLEGCSCLDFSENALAPHGKRGQLEYLDYIRLRFETGDTRSQFAFGFYSESMLPQQWSYGTLGHAIEGDIRSEEVAEGKTEFTEGTAVTRFAFRVSGDGPAGDGSTTLIFGYDKYVTYIVSSYGSKFSIFVIMTVLITFCAAINNFGLFDIFFPEKSDTAKLEPNLCLIGCCPCCICCTEEANEEEAGP